MARVTSKIFKFILFLVLFTSRKRTRGIIGNTVFSSCIVSFYPIRVISSMTFNTVVGSGGGIGFISSTVSDLVGITGVFFFTDGFFGIFGVENIFTVIGEFHT